MARKRIDGAEISVALKVFRDRQGLAGSLADAIANGLTSAITARGVALLAVSGGTTPELLFKALSQRKVKWKNVIVTLVDERFVPPTAERSNERLVRQTLLQNAAAAATFVPLYSDAADPVAALHDTADRLHQLPWPLDVAVLGMGTDGHTASFFPDANELSNLLDPTRRDLVMAVNAASAGEPRITLPLSRLVEAPFVALHIEGQAKKAVLDAALLPTSTMPTTTVLRNSTQPVQIHWAP